MADSGNHLKGVKLVLTGDLKCHERDDATRRLKALGADVTGSVSGKTTAVIAGENPGATKLGQARDRKLPVLNEDQYLALLAGKTLAEVVAGAAAGPGATPPDEAAPAPKAPAVPFPRTIVRPRDGLYTEYFEGTGEVRIQGTFVAGLKHGSWKKYHENGQLQEDYSYEHGLRHGPELDFHANGQKMCVGQNLRGKRHGEWSWYHEDGKLDHSYVYDEAGLRHGEHVWDLQDGSKRARGRFEADKMHGHWTWWHEPGLERLERDYQHGVFHGTEEGFFPGGALAHRRSYRNGGKHGLEEAFRSTGPGTTTLAYRGEWRAGREVGEHLSVDEAGRETRTTYTAGLKEESKAPAIREKALKKLARAKDHWAKADALGEGVSYGERAPHLLHLWREGHVDVAKDPDLWELLSEMSDFLTGEEVARLLAGVPDKGVEPNGSFLPYWPDTLDRIVMTAYCREPEVLDAAAAGLSTRMRKGLAFVQARFGRKPSVSLKSEMAVLAKKHVEQYGLGQKVLFPDGEGGVTGQAIFTDHRATATTPLFARFISLFGTEETWRAALKKKAEELAGGGRLPFRLLRPVIEGATPEEMVRYIDAIGLDNDTQDLLFDALTKWRSDGADTLVQIALGVKDTGLRKWPTCCAALLALHREGREAPPELVAALPFASESPTYSSGWYTEPLQALADHLKKDPSFVAATIPIAPGCAVPRMKLMREALATLPEGALKVKIEAQLSAEYGKTAANQYLYLVGDPDLWARALAVTEKDSYGSSDGAVYGFGDLGEAGLPLLVGLHKRAKGAAWKEAAAKVLWVALARAVVDRGTFDPEYDRYLDFSAVAKDYDYRFYEPFLSRIIHLLPASRAEPLLLAGLASKHFSRAFSMIGSHPTERVLHAAFTELLAREATFKHEDQQSVGRGLGALPEAREWVKWIFQSGGGGGLDSAIREAVGHAALEQIQKELEEGGVEKPAEIDHVEKVRRRAEAAGGGSERIYLLRRVDEAHGEDLNRIGGAAPGVDAARWPRFDGEPMVHLFTLDLDTMPELRARVRCDDGGEARAVSVFCSTPNNNEAYSADTDETAVVVSSRAQVAAPAAPPDDTDAMEPARFEPVAVQVNPSVWKGRSDLSKEIYRASGRALGEPIWLQSPEHGGDLLCQFDDSFIHMNLGDTGVMYVFSDAAFWQCH